jgi:hypothetical protein
MPDVDSSHQAALLEVLAVYQADYDDAAQHGRNIEGKAQASITLAGIFLAAGFALVRELDPATEWWVRGLLLLSAVALMLAVVFAVLALKVRSVTAPPSGADLEKLVDDVFRAPDADTLSEDSRNLVYERIRSWKHCVERRKAVNADKARHLLQAQLALLAAVVLVALLTGGAIVLPGQFGK